MRIKKIYQALQYAVVLAVAGLILQMGVGSSEAQAVPDITSTASVTATAAVPVIQIPMAGRNSAGFTLSGTWSATFTIKVTTDGVHWTNAQYANSTGTVQAGSTVTSNGTYQLVGVGGAAQFGLVPTAYTSGTAVITMRASTTSSFIQAPAATLTISGAVTQGAGNSASPWYTTPGPGVTVIATSTSITCSSSPTLLVGSGPRNSATVTNNGSSNIYLGGSSVTDGSIAQANGGILLAPGGSAYYPPNDWTAIYGVTSSGTDVVGAQSR